MNTYQWFLGILLCLVASYFVGYTTGSWVLGVVAYLVPRFYLRWIETPAKE